MADTKSPHNGTLSLMLDFGPLLVFFLTYKGAGWIWGPGNPITAMTFSTAAFMLSIVIAVIVSKVKLGRVSPMLWLSALLILFFGGLTIYFHDQRFIQIKPTIIYAFFALMLFAGLVRGKPLLKYLLQAAYDGLTHEGWLKLSRNWALFFVAMAVANEVMRRSMSFDAWLAVKVWGVTIVSVVFAVANIPMLMRHGLSLGEEPAADEIGETTPPQG
ncbi:intracellular septation protein [Sphingobium wenxiniae]|jgi:intracellular septation protein|uniref:Inner membrane-spanning protein YciB n=2 Tax=Sphingobium TaxID=165695 RepID=T0GRW2_9SPHN|nr:MULTISPECIES: septation protein IspZ [Sphingobium]EQB03412.1 septation protein A [Sphingobium baderi LL03]KMS62587.1 septation protein A [Sphingobium baderi LL03]MBB6190600.1 intracellular septation protein [Sphingobium wenxiniae]TWH94378.1 intracellular septation protein [Sphingobium wenxiniae]WRD76651.1 septation protein IspZ [Sphingobium baderi]